MSRKGHKGGREPRKLPAIKGDENAIRLSEKHTGRNKRRRGVYPPTKPVPAQAAHP